HASDWSATVLVFSDQWFSHRHDDAWRAFYLYLDAQRSVSLPFWEFALSVAREKATTKMSPYVLNTAHHLLTIAHGRTPGFAPAIDNTAAPIDVLTKAYQDVYGFMDYPATFLVPESIDNRMVYYSFNYPTAITFTQKPREKTNLLTDIYEIRSLLRVYSEVFKPSPQPSPASGKGSIMSISKRFDYFHSAPDKYFDILSTKEIIRLDSAFPCDDVDAFPARSPFFRACARVSS
ncbi:MAG: hypothetical protein ACE365_07845, partial [Gammaproteobacteria bacterium]